jgi:hypothetical protein
MKPLEQIITDASNRGLSYRFILEEVKREKGNVNERQVVAICNTMDCKPVDVMKLAKELNVLNVPKKLLKKLYV